MVYKPLRKKEYQINTKGANAGENENIQPGVKRIHESNLEQIKEKDENDSLINEDIIDYEALNKMGEREDLDDL